MNPSELCSRYIHVIMQHSRCNSLPPFSPSPLPSQYFVTENAEQVTLADISSRLPVKWSSQSDASNPRGSPPPRQRGCDMCGCRRGRKLHRRGGQPPQLASLPATMDYGEVLCRI